MKIDSNYGSVYFKGLYSKPDNVDAQKPKTVSEPPVYSENTGTFYNNSFLASLEIQKIQNEINEKFILKGSNDWNEDRKTVNGDNLQDFSDGIFEVMQKHSIDTPNKILKAFEKTANMSEEEITNYSEQLSLWAYRYCAKKKMQVKQEFLKDFLTSIQRMKNVGTGNSPISMEDLKLLLDEKVKRVCHKHNEYRLNERVKNEIKYSSDEVLPDEKIVLNEQEMQELKNLAFTEEDLSYEELCQKAINKYVGGDYSLKGASKRVQKAVLNSLPRYNSSKITHYYDGLNDFEKHPVVRWLFIKNPEEFVQNFNKGEIYKYNNIQSCSKIGTYCENEFKDSTPEMTVKFIIHPKSETSNARDLGERKYGDNEVLYPANQEFVILDKELVKFHDREQDFYRWVIHMQEK